jgi:hypothetical protein
MGTNNFFMSLIFMFEFCRVQRRLSNMDAGLPPFLSRVRRVFRPAVCPRKPRPSISITDATAAARIQSPRWESDNVRNFFGQDRRSSLSPLTQRFGRGSVREPAHFILSSWRGRPRAPRWAGGRG